MPAVGFFEGRAEGNFKNNALTENHGAIGLAFTVRAASPANESRRTARVFEDRDVRVHTTQYDTKRNNAGEEKNMPMIWSKVDSKGIEWQVWRKQKGR